MPGHDGIANQGHPAPPAVTKSRVRLTLCLLTWNEVDGCRHDVPNLPLHAFDEIYAIDGGSTDGTVEYLRACGIAVHQQDKGGYNQAYISAFRRCSTDALVLYHPKGNVDPEGLPRFRLFFDAGYDVVIASRMLRGARNEEDDKRFRPRKWFVLGLALSSALIWRRRGPVIWDVLHGLRGMRRERFFDIDPLEAGLSIDLEIVVRGYRKRFRMIEFPIEERGRLAGTTHFKAYQTGKQLLAYLWTELRRSR